MEHPRYAALAALQDVPEANWIYILWAILAELDRQRTEGLHPDYAGMALKAAIAHEFAKLDGTPKRGTPERP